MKFLIQFTLYLPGLVWFRFLGHEWSISSQILSQKGILRRISVVSHLMQIVFSVTKDSKIVHNILTPQSCLMGFLIPFPPTHWIGVDLEMWMFHKCHISHLLPLKDFTPIGKHWCMSSKFINQIGFHGFNYRFIVLHVRHNKTNQFTVSINANLQIFLLLFGVRNLF